MPGSTSTTAAMAQPAPGVSDSSAVSASTPISARTSPNSVHTSQVPGDCSPSSVGVGQPQTPVSASTARPAGNAHVTARANRRSRTAQGVQIPSGGRKTGGGTTTLWSSSGGSSGSAPGTSAGSTSGAAADPLT